MSNELQSTQASRVCSTFAAVASNLRGRPIHADVQFTRASNSRGRQQRYG